MLQLHVEALRPEDDDETLQRRRGPVPVTCQEAPRPLPVTAACQCYEPGTMARQQGVAEAGHALAAGQVGGTGEATEVGIALLVRGQEGEVWSELSCPDPAQVLAARFAVPGRPLPRQCRTGRLPCPGRC